MFRAGILTSEQADALNELLATVRAMRDPTTSNLPTVLLNDVQQAYDPRPRTWLAQISAGPDGNGRYTAAECLTNSAGAVELVGGGRTWAPTTARLLASSGTFTVGDVVTVREAGYDASSVARYYADATGAASLDVGVAGAASRAATDVSAIDFGVVEGSPSSPIVVESGDAGCVRTGSWTSETGGYSGTYHRATTNSEVATFTITGLTVGRVTRVMVTWPSQGNTNGSQFVYYKIYRADGTTQIGSTYGRDHRTGSTGFVFGGADWDVLGVITPLDTSIKIEVTSAGGTGKYWGADAVYAGPYAYQSGSSTWFVDEPTTGAGRVAIAEAGLDFGGIVSTTAQTFSGDKVFVGTVYVAGDASDPTADFSVGGNALEVFDTTIEPNVRIRGSLRVKHAPSYGGTESLIDCQDSAGVSRVVVYPPIGSNGASITLDSVTVVSGSSGSDTAIRLAVAELPASPPVPYLAGGWLAVAMRYPPTYPPPPPPSPDDGYVHVASARQAIFSHNGPFAIATATNSWSSPKIGGTLTTGGMEFVGGLYIGGRIAAVESVTGGSGITASAATGAVTLSIGTGAIAETMIASGAVTASKILDGAAVKAGDTVRLTKYT